MVKKAPFWAWTLATGLWSGFLRPAPGTWGSFVGLIVWFLVTKSLAVSVHFFMPLYVRCIYYSVTIEIIYIILYIALVKLAIFVSNMVVQTTTESDPAYIVIDEWVGMWIALWPVRWDFIYNCHNLLTNRWQLTPILLMPFITFRLFDIYKPWPIYQVQVLNSGYGIVADDLIAGLYSIPIVIIALQWFKILQIT